MRADAARNRARVLGVAFETFAAEGLAVPIDEIARRAGVGPGTVYRHFPTKEALFQAVIENRVRSIVSRGRALLEEGPGTALFDFLREMVHTSAADHGIADALTSYGVDAGTAANGAEAAFGEILSDLLVAAQRMGTVRSDVGAAEVKALLTVCQGALDNGAGVADRVANVIVDGLRSPPRRSSSVSSPSSEASPPRCYDGDQSPAAIDNDDFISGEDTAHA